MFLACKYFKWVSNRKYTFWIRNTTLCTIPLRLVHSKWHWGLRCTFSSTAHCLKAWKIVLSNWKKLCKDTCTILSKNLTAFEANSATFQKCTYFQNLDHCGWLDINLDSQLNQAAHMNSIKCISFRVSTLVL